MMSEPSIAPPRIEGYEYRSYIKGGGFSEVFRYHNLRLERDVAIKVLTLRSNAAEAQMMARLSDHPNIVEVFDTGTTDDGYQYIVMKLYQAASYADRLNRQALSLEDVLSLGVQLSGAVEWAHSNGVMHRDIKPANVLVDRSGRPGLTDFGISSRDVNASQDSVSVPWASPEALREEPTDELSDVYSLAATLYHLYEGRPPHHDPALPGEQNDRQWLAQRAVLKDALPMTRAGTPESFRTLMRAALNRDPQARPASAKALGYWLQQIEGELHFARTPMVVLDLETYHDDSAHDHAADADDANRTVSNSARLLDADSNRTVSVSEVSRRTVSAADLTVDVGSLSSGLIQYNPEGTPIGSGTSRRTTTLNTPTHDGPLPADDLVAEPAPKRGKLAVVALAAAVVIVVGVVAVLAGGNSGDTDRAEEAESFAPVTVPAVVPRVGGLRIERLDPSTVVARWDAVSGAEYGVRRCDVDGAATETVATTEFAVVDVPEGSSACIAVYAKKGGSISDEQWVSGP